MLALNLGSASLKAASYSLLSSTVAERPTIRQTGRMSVETTHESSTAPDDAARILLSETARGLPELGDAPTVVAHSIVHGADRAGPEELTPATLAQRHTLSTLAPLHQPPALALVRAAIKRHVANKKSDVVRIYLPPDANCRRST